MSEHTLPLHSTAAVTIMFGFAHACITLRRSLMLRRETSINQLVYLLGEANPKPVAAARETAAIVLKYRWRDYIQNLSLFSYWAQ